MVNTKLTILHSSTSPGPTKFFNTKNYVFLDAATMSELIDSGIAELKMGDIPYIILFNADVESFLDTTTSRFISEAEAMRLIDSGVAKLMPSPGSATENDPVDPDDFQERVFRRATYAGGAATAVAGAASLPYLAGFTANGVAAGSAAAAAQSSIGSVAAGSFFATMQSVGATTLLGTSLPLVVAGVAATGTVAAGVKWYNRCWRNQGQGELEAPEDDTPEAGS